MKSIDRKLRLKGARAQPRGAAKPQAMKPSQKLKLRRAQREGEPPPAPVEAPATPRAERAAKRTLREQRRRVYSGEDDTLKLLRATLKAVSKSQKSFKDVYLDGGPTPSTLNRWAKQGVRQPGLVTVMGALQACGNLRIAIVDEDGQIVFSDVR